MLSYQNNLDYMQELDLSSLRDELGLLVNLRAREPNNTQVRDLHRMQRLRYRASKKLEADEKELTPKRIKRKLEKIREELALYSDQPDSDIESSYDLHVNGNRIPSPRARYLVKRRKHLMSLSKSYRQLKPIAARNVDAEPTFLQKLAENKVVKFLKSVFEIGKKVIDVIDDAWTAIGNAALPKFIVENVSPVLIGVISGIVHATEGLKSLITFINTLRKPTTVYSKGKAAAHLYTAATGGTGLGLSIAYIVGGAGLTVAGFGIMPAIIPGLLATIYTVALFHYVHRYRLINNRIKELRESITRNEQRLEKLLADKEREIQLRKKLTKETKTLNSGELKSHLKKITASHHKQLQIEAHIASIYKHYNPEKVENEIQHLELKRIKAEREIAFRTVEVTASILVVAGVIFGTAAIVGASIASMGALPIALIVVGVTLGLCMKIFQLVDSKRDNKYSDAIIGSIKGFFNRLFSSSPENKMEISLQEKSSKKVGADVTLLRKPRPREAKLSKSQYDARMFKSRKMTPSITPLAALTFHR